MVDYRVNYDVLSVVRKPTRYIGGEFNSVYKNPDKTEVRIALAFPDVYKVGMSHLGLKILYNILNSQENIYAERVFAPWPDMEQQMRERGIPLLTLETAHEVRKMDMVGFSLQYELCRPPYCKCWTWRVFPFTHWIGQKRTPWYWRVALYVLIQCPCRISLTHF